MNRRPLPRVVVLAGLLAACAGCGSKLVPVEGVVNLDGQPVDRATVTFIPQGEGRQATGVTGADGHFTLATGPDSGAPPGNYKVTVTKSESVPGANPGEPADMAKMMANYSKVKGKLKSLLPQKYSRPDTTDLTCTVPPPSKPVVLDLKSK